MSLTAARSDVKMREQSLERERLCPGVLVGTWTTPWRQNFPI